MCILRNTNLYARKDLNRKPKRKSTKPSTKTVHAAHPIWGIIYPQNIISYQIQILS